MVGQKELGSEQVNILAKNEISQFGLRKGEVYDPEKVREAIIDLKSQLTRKGIKIKKVIVNIGGPHLFGVESKGLVSVSRADQRISQEDIQRVLQAAQAVNLPSNKEILDIFPKEFIIDGEGEIKNPLGLKGIRLEAKVLLICVFSPVLENLERAVLESGFEIEEVIPSPLASSRAVLTSEQKELGVAVVDIGSGTTSLSVFGEGNLIDFAIFPIGSSNITNDIAICLRTEIATAERIKREFGFIGFPTEKGKNKREKIRIPEKGISLSKSFLKNIIKSRVSEIFSETAKSLKRISKETILPGGVILTGGGASLPGLVEFAKQKFELPCYLSSPKRITGVEETNFSTAAGLLLCGFDLEEGYRDKKLIKDNIKSKLKKVFKMFLP